MNAIAEIFDIVGTNAGQVSTMLGLSRGTVYDWINEKRSIPHERLNQLQEVLKVPRHFFLKEKLSKHDKITLLEIYATSILGEQVLVSVKEEERAC